MVSGLPVFKRSRDTALAPSTRSSRASPGGAVRSAPRTDFLGGASRARIKGMPGAVVCQRVVPARPGRSADAWFGPDRGRQGPAGLARRCPRRTASRRSASLHCGFGRLLIRAQCPYDRLDRRSGQWAVSDFLQALCQSHAFFESRKIIARSLGIFEFSGTISFCIMELGDLCGHFFNPLRTKLDGVKVKTSRKREAQFKLLL